MLSIIGLVSQIFGKKLIKLTERSLSHKDVIKGGGHEEREQD